MWTALKAQATEIRRQAMIDLFADEGRAEEFSVRFDGMLFDYSKTYLTRDTRTTLIALARERDVPGRREAMFRGEKINETEGRAVLHTALRASSDDPLTVDGQDVMPGVRATLDRMAEFAGHVRDETFAGAGGKITDVVNIGIGGSHLGPEMATRALAPYHDGPRCHFVSNVDGADITDTLKGLDPTTTLVIVASKTFTTIETMTNARRPRRIGWRRQLPRPVTSSRRCPARWTKPARSGSRRSAFSGSRIGSAGAIPCGGRSACHSCWPSVLMISARSSRVVRRWTRISETPRSS